MRDISKHIRHLLLILGTIFLLFAFRIYYLTIIQHEYHVKESKSPALKTIIKRPNRGTIRDRFNHPLAINTISYSVCILYDPIKKLPRKNYQKNNKEKILIYPRKEAIKNLSHFLEKITSTDSQTIEDLIYSKASLFPNTPFKIMDDIPEELFYKLKISERNYPGLYIEMNKKRTYPKGKIGCHILGYMGSINEKEHHNIQSKISILKEFLSCQKSGLLTPLPIGYNSIRECKDALDSLINKSYTIHSHIGKTGIEKNYDTELKGNIGKDFYLVDHKGNRRCKLPESYDEISGRRILLTISGELQEHCEKLLAETEQDRMENFSKAGKNHNNIERPWILGGSIVAMIPQTGEIIALASYPTFDPNDFISPNKQASLKWIEAEDHIARLFNGIESLKKDIFNSNKRHWDPISKEVNYDYIISSILSKKSNVKKALKQVNSIHNANFILNCIEMLMSFSEVKCIHNLIDAIYQDVNKDISTFHNTKNEEKKRLIQILNKKTSLLKEIRQEIDPYFSVIDNNNDKILFLDILRLFCPNHLFDDTLLACTGHESLANYKEFCNAKIKIEEEVQIIAKKIFHQNEFTEWRATYFQDYLKSKRSEEKQQKKHPRPYSYYLKKVEDSLFKQFFNINKWEFIQSYLTIGAPIQENDIRNPYFQTLIEKSINNNELSYTKLKNHLKKLPNGQIIPYLKTMRSYQELNRELYGKYYFPFKSGRNSIEKDLARAFYPGKGFGYSKSFAFTENMPLGSSFKIFTGYEALMKCFDKNNHLPFPINPMTIIDQSPPYSTKITSDTVLGYHSDYTPIKRIYKGGRLPRGHLNIGKVDFINAMAKSSNLYFSLLSANIIQKPEDLLKTTRLLGFGEKTNIDLPYETKGFLPNDILNNKTSLYSFAFGQHSLIVTPLQTAVALSALATNGEILKPQIVKAIANIEPEKDPKSILSKKNIKYKNQYKNIGIFFPLLPEGETISKAAYLVKTKKEIKNILPLPQVVQKTLMQSIYNVVNSSHGTARPSVINSLLNNPVKRSIYKNEMSKMGGKTSTAEIAYNPTLDRQQDPIIIKNIWFTAVSFNEASAFSHPDLVVIIQLNFGNHGKEAAPLAASVINKWHNILRKEYR